MPELTRKNTFYFHQNFDDSPLRSIDPSLTANNPKNQETIGDNILKSLNTQEKKSWLKTLGLQPGFYAKDNIDVMMFWSA